MGSPGNPGEEVEFSMEIRAGRARRRFVNQQPKLWLNINASQQKMRSRRNEGGERGCLLFPFSTDNVPGSFSAFVFSPYFSVAISCPPLHKSFNMWLLIISACLTFASLTIAQPLETVESGVRTQTPSAVLGTSGMFALLASSTITNTGSSILTGDVGLYAGSSVTGFPPGIILGTVHVDDGVAQRAQTYAKTAYNFIYAQTPPTLLTSVTGLDGLTLVPGVYKAKTSLSLAQLGSATLILDGKNNPDAAWYFQVGSTLVTGAGGVATIQMINGGKACNVYWQVGSSATINEDVQPSSVFLGSVIALVSVTIGSGTVQGSMIARGGAVTISTASNITAQNFCRSCVAPAWSQIPPHCGTVPRMTAAQCSTVRTKWQTGECAITVANACPVPEKPVFWLGAGSSTSSAGGASCKNDGGCKLWFDCYQVTCPKLCAMMTEAPCFWRGDRCVYLP